MINFFKKPPKVEFLCRVPGALEVDSLIPIRLYKPEWLLLSSKEYSESKKTCEHISRTVAKCSGIRKLYTTGWIVTSWQDLEIFIDENNNSSWSSPINQGEYFANYLDRHDSSLVKHSEFLSKQPSIFKIQTPWVAKIPKGYNMMQLSVPYQEHDLFTTAHGVYERSMGLFELNIQLIWHKKGAHLIKAGTPLAHFVLIKDEKIDEEIRYINDKEKECLQKMINIKKAALDRNMSKIKQKIINLLNFYNF